MSQITDKDTVPNEVDKAQPKLHPISLYLKIWGLLFVLSTMSYLVDFYQVQGILRWTLIIVFMLLKAGLIITIFMHVRWERLALKLLLFIPPLAIVVLISLMAIEGDYTLVNRLISFLSV
ncbi:cytochrome C oxidase subunit IV family protein [Shewanella eurypsychrophilus]|uniref:Cytochrome C oxidase subunit IV family protein n=1 Tax=Shewanella eurypsychrophilus TaxID=2593656 RepID=A0ABX6VEQ9_9GAMM|nr:MULTISPECIES: cytochrome C oxidase subunit IV family protein [Shewanella]QFU25086.1 cytochrome C oxidase subunit IV [Shewanella sp. YLB-09]QPG60258.1 cytochrome C oxidase subunit IV family protein [Shewanella eurypsychrophilus]